MEAKKTSKTDLESKRMMFREVGFIVALVMLFCAFESKTYQEEVTEIILPTEAAEVEEVLPVFVPRKAARPLPRVTQMPLLEVLEVVDDEMSLESEVELNSDIASPVEGSENGTGDWVSTGFEGDERGEDDVFIVVEENPRFKGDLQRWLQKNLRYPMMAVENHIEGKVYVSFIVEKDGSISSVEVLRSADPVLEAEAVRVVKAMPQWEPGRQRNKAVRVKFTLPIVFRLQ